MTAVEWRQGNSAYGRQYHRESDAVVTARMIEPGSFMYVPRPCRDTVRTAIDSKCSLYELWRTRQRYAASSVAAAAATKPALIPTATATTTTITTQSGFMTITERVVPPPSTTPSVLQMLGHDYVARTYRDIIHHGDSLIVSSAAPSTPSLLPVLIAPAPTPSSAYASMFASASSSSSSSAPSPYGNTSKATIVMDDYNGWVKTNNGHNWTIPYNMQQPRLYELVNAAKHDTQMERDEDSAMWNVPSPQLAMIDLIAHHYYISSNGEATTASKKDEWTALFAALQVTPSLLLQHCRVTTH